MEEYTMKMCGTYTYNGILFSHLKKSQNNAISSDKQRPRDCHIEWSKTEKNKYHMISLKCIILKKNDTNQLIYKSETYQKGKVGRIH